MIKIDNIDNKILDILQGDAKITNAQLANEIGLSPSSTLERVRRLESIGVIKYYSSILDTKKIGINYTFILNIKLKSLFKESIDNFIDIIKNIPEVTEAYRTLGNTNFILKINCGSQEEVDVIVYEKILDNEDILEIQSNLVLDQVKDNTSLKIYI